MHAQGNEYWFSTVLAHTADQNLKTTSWTLESLLFNMIFYNIYLHDIKCFTSDIQKEKNYFHCPRKIFGFDILKMYSFKIFL